MTIREAALTDAVLERLIALSRLWEAENSCHGYRANGREDIEGERVFLAEEDGLIVGYLLGHTFRTEKNTSVIPADTPCFEVEELYVIPARRSEGIGRALFSFAANSAKDEAGFVTLSTATKNWRAILHFYIDEVGMEFWNARLFMPTDRL